MLAKTAYPSEIFRRNGPRFDGEFALIACSHQRYFSIVKQGQQTAECECGRYWTSGHKILAIAANRATLEAVARALRARLYAGGSPPDFVPVVQMEDPNNGGASNIYFQVQITQRKARLIRAWDAAEFVLDKKGNMISMIGESKLRQVVDTFADPSLGENRLSQREQIKNGG